MENDESLPAEQSGIADGFPIDRPQSVEHVEGCCDLLSRAKQRKHPSLSYQEYVELRSKLRKAHWSPNAKPNGFLGHWSYDTLVNKIADAALDDYLHQHGIVVIPPETPEPPHPYRVEGVAGLSAVDVVERKAKLARKLKELHVRIESIQ